MIIEVIPINIEPTDEEDAVTWTVKMYVERSGARWLGAHIGVPILLNFPNKHPADVLSLVDAEIVEPELKNE